MYMAVYGQDRTPLSIEYPWSSDVVDNIDQVTTKPAKLVGFGADVSAVQEKGDKHFHSCPLIKVALVGDVCVGKTQIMNRCMDGTFSELYRFTLATDFLQKKMRTSNGTLVQLIVLDLPGNKDMRRTSEISFNFMKDTKGVILVYDITNKESFNSLHDHYTYVESKGLKEAQYIMVGNKLDLEANRIVDKDDAQNFANSLNVPYMEISAKDETNLVELFSFLIDHFVKET